MYYIYVLFSEKDLKLYIGLTELNPVERLKQYNSGKTESTRNRRPLQLVYYEMYLNQQDARGRERFLKGGSGHVYLKKQLRNFFMRRGVEQPGSSQGS